MKNLKIMNQQITCFFSGIFIAMVLLVLMVSCNSVEPENPKIDPGKPILEIGVQATILQVDRLVTGSPNGSIKESQDEIVEAVVTIHSEDGKPTEYNLRKIMVNNDAGNYKTEKIDLPIGNYQIITFYVLGEDNKISDVTPLKNSPLGDQVDKALPYPFQVSVKENRGNADPDGEEVAIIVLPALSTEGRKPEDFGLHSFLLDIKDAFYFFVALVEKNRSAGS
jgi:hypothetical protein